MKKNSEYLNQFFENASTGIYHTLFENSNDAILIYRNNEIIKYNRKAADLFGFSRESQFYPLSSIFPDLQPDGSHSVTKSHLSFSVF
ncbi:MAG: PAS domain-containing protein [Bacteroidetes bacterium]|nr:PAS domain-containing protein [Bacteroidota bacterium]